MTFRVGSTLRDRDFGTNLNNQVGTEDYPTTTFNIRQPGYAKLKQKGPSGSTMYMPYAVDVIDLKKKREHIASSMEFPPLPPHLAGPVNGVPVFFIVNLMMPSYEPTMRPFGGGSQDGPNHSIVITFMMTPETREHLQNLESAPPGVRLLKAFIEDDSKEMREKFKFMCNSFNATDLEMNMILRKLVVTYNAKPVLARPQGSYHADPTGQNRYFEADLDINKFPYFATKGLVTAKILCEEMVLDLGFVIEGRCEEELPEMMLGVHRFDMFAPTKWGVNLDEAIASDARKKTEEAAEQAALESGSVP